MAPRSKAAVKEVGEENQDTAGELTLVTEEQPEQKTRTRRSFNYDPQALGASLVEDEPEDFTPRRTRSSEKESQVRWLEAPLAESYERDVWKGVTVPEENVDAVKQAVTYAVGAFFDNMGIRFNFKTLADEQVRVSFKMADKRPFGGRRKTANRDPE